MQNKNNLFQAFKASSGLILLILLLITKLDVRPINSDKTNIGTKQNGLNEKENPVDKEEAISKLATTETIKISTDAITTEMRHWNKE